MLLEEMFPDSSAYHWYSSKTHSVWSSPLDLNKKESYRKWRAWLASLNTVLFLFSPTLSTFFYAEGPANHSSVDPNTQYSCRVGVCSACSACSRTWTLPDEVVLDNDDIQSIGATCANCYFNGEGHVAHHFVWRWSRSQFAVARHTLTCWSTWVSQLKQEVRVKQASK